AAQEQARGQAGLDSQSLLVKAIAAEDRAVKTIGTVEGNEQKTIPGDVGAGSWRGRVVQEGCERNSRSAYLSTKAQCEDCCEGDRQQVGCGPEEAADRRAIEKAGTPGGRTHRT